MVKSNALEFASTLVERLEERIRTLEDALRPFADEGHIVDEEHRTSTHDGVPGRCEQCYRSGPASAPAPWPCSYETARRAMEGEG